MPKPTSDDLQLVLAQAPIALFCVDRSGVLTLCEGGALHLVGARAGGALADLADPIASNLKRALAGKTCHADVDIRGAWLAVDYAPLRDEAGTIVGALGFARDMTEQKGLQERLREAEQRYRRQSEVAFEALVIHEQGVIVDANLSCARLFGYDSPEGLIGRHALELSAPESHALIREKIATASETPYEAIGVRRDGTTFPGELRGRVVMWNGRPLRVTAIRDLEQERRLLHEVDAERRRHRLLADELSSVLEQMVEAVVVVDADGGHVRANQAARTLFDMDYAPTGELFRRALRGERIVGAELGLRRGADTQYLRVSAAPIRDGDGRINGAVAVVSDLTAEITFDHLKDQFLSVAAHELKTPVAVIKSASQAALESVGDDGAPLRRTLERIERGADRLDRVVADLLDASQLQLGRLALHTEPIDLGALVTAVAQRIMSEAPLHRLRLDCAPEVVVPGDRTRLEQVVTVLMRNAIKYSPQGGDVEVRVVRDGDEALVEVRDHGIGIARDKQAHVFESFYSAHGGTPYDFGGIGIGLHVAREFVRRHGGRIWLESDEGAGATFSFALPAESATNRTRP